MSNGSRHSNVCVISSFPFAICGFDAISRRKRLKLVKIIITLIRKIYWIVIQAGAWCSVPLRDTYHSAKIQSWCHNDILEEPCLYKAWSYAATSVVFWKRSCFLCTLYIFLKRTIFNCKHLRLCENRKPIDLNLGKNRNKKAFFILIRLFWSKMQSTWDQLPYFLAYKLRLMTWFYIKWTSKYFITYA